MKKAVIETGGKQYLVEEGQIIEVELLNSDEKIVSFSAIMVIDGSNSQVGKPILDKIKVTAEVVNANKQTDKVTSIRYKAKKRVHTVRGHRQRQAVLKIQKIA
jgi:large subunit ribosomal protein L21